MKVLRALLGAAFYALLWAAWFWVGKKIAFGLVSGASETVVRGLLLTGGVWFLHFSLIPRLHARYALLDGLRFPFQVMTLAWRASVILYCVLLLKSFLVVSADPQQAPVWNPPGEPDREEIHKRFGSRDESASFINPFSTDFGDLAMQLALIYFVGCFVVAVPLGFMEEQRYYRSANT